MNCSCLDAKMDGNTVASVTGWQSYSTDGYMFRKCTLCNVAINMPFVHLPETLVKDLRVEVSEDGETWCDADSLTDIKRQVVYVSVGKTAKAVRTIPEASYGKETIKIFTLDMRQAAWISANEWEGSLPTAFSLGWALCLVRHNNPELR